MKIHSLELLRAKHARVSQLLARAVLRSFPVGAFVFVTRGRGEMLARVSNGPSWWADPTRLNVFSVNGAKVHSADFRDCRLVGARDQKLFTREELLAAKHGGRA